MCAEGGPVWRQLGGNIAVTPADSVSLSSDGMSLAVSKSATATALTFRWSGDWSVHMPEVSPDYAGTTARDIVLTSRSGLVAAVRGSDHLRVYQSCDPVDMFGPNPHLGRTGCDSARLYDGSFLKGYCEGNGIYMDPASDEYRPENEGFKAFFTTCCRWDSDKEACVSKDGPVWRERIGKVDWIANRVYTPQPVAYTVSGWCHQINNAYTGSLRAIASGENPGSTAEEKARHCYEACHTDGTYASDRYSGYSDSNFWDDYTVADVVSFKVHKTNGNCYCMTSRPIGDTGKCTGEGYTLENDRYGNYDIYYPVQYVLEPDSSAVQYISQGDASAQGLCHRGSEGFDGTVRTIAPGENPGTTAEEQAQHCFESCHNPGQYASNNGALYSDPDFWDYYGVTSIVGFQVDKNNGQCYCATSIPIGGGVCSGERYKLFDGSGYNIYYVAGDFAVSASDRLYLPQSYTVGASGWCDRVSDNFKGTVRTIAPGENPGTTPEERANRCFESCHSTGLYASNTDSPYTDLNFWEDYTAADIVSFKVDKNNGQCYCMTSRPVADTNKCSREGYNYQDQSGYDIYYIEDKLPLTASDRVSLSDDGVVFAVTDTSAGATKTYYWSGPQLKSNVHQSCDPVGMFGPTPQLGLNGCDSARSSNGVFSQGYCEGTASSMDRTSGDYNPDFDNEKAFYTTCCEWNAAASTCEPKEGPVWRAQDVNISPVVTDGLSFLDHLSLAYTGLGVDDVSVSSTGDIAAAVSPSSLRVYGSLSWYCGLRVRGVESEDHVGCDGARYAGGIPSGPYCEGTSPRMDPESPLYNPLFENHRVFYTSCCSWDAAASACVARSAPLLPWSATDGLFDVSHSSVDTSGASSVQLSGDGSLLLVSSSTFSRVLEWSLRDWRWNPLGRAMPGSSSKPSLSADGSTVAVVTSPGVRAYKQHACDAVGIVGPNNQLGFTGCDSARYSSGAFSSTYCLGTSPLMNPADSRYQPRLDVMREFYTSCCKWDEGSCVPADMSEGLWTELGDGISYAASSVDLSDDGSLLALGSTSADTAGSNNGQVRVLKWSSGSWLPVGSDVNAGISPICSSPIASITPSQPVSGCAGAVLSGGTPSESYCVGRQVSSIDYSAEIWASYDRTHETWYQSCCSWMPGLCFEKLDAIGGQTNALFGGAVRLSGNGNALALGGAGYTFDTFGQGVARVFTLQGVCSTCAPGKFQADTSQPGCLDCPVGKAASGLGNTECDICASGSVPRADGTECTTCSAGFYASGNECVECPAGFVSAESATECEDCARGSISNSAGTACDSCAPGRYEDAYGNMCWYCPEGYVSTSAGATECEDCARGSISNSAGTACDTCAPGRYENDYRNTCWHCPEGYVGTSAGATACENVNDCTSASCKNGGVCTDLVNDFECACPAGYSGKDCGSDINDCVSDTPRCLNGGTCIDKLNDYECKCAPGWQGRNCAEDADDCASVPCLNGATCKDEYKSYTCTCATGFNGTDCENNIDDCVSVDCGADVCVDGVNEYTCEPRVDYVLFMALSAVVAVVAICTYGCCECLSRPVRPRRRMV